MLAGDRDIKVRKLNHLNLLIFLNQDFRTGVDFIESISDNFCSIKKKEIIDPKIVSPLQRRSLLCFSAVDLKRSKIKCSYFI